MISEDVKELQTITEWNFNDIIKYAIFKILNVASEDVTKYVIAVENLESLLIDELEKDKEYAKNIQKRQAFLDEEYGFRDEVLEKKMMLMAQFKFRELIKRIKKKIPEDVVGAV